MDKSFGAVTLLPCILLSAADRAAAPALSSSRGEEERRGRVICILRPRVHSEGRSSLEVALKEVHKEEGFIPG